MIDSRFYRRPPSVERQRVAAVGALLASACLAIVSLAGPEAVTARQSSAGAPKTLPADLALVPPDALGFVQLRLSSIWDTGFVKKARPHLSREMAQAESEAAKRLGLPLKSIERVTFLWRSLKDDYPLVIVATIDSYDRRKILSAVLPNAEEHRYKDAVYYTSKKTGRASLRFVNDRVYVSGSVEDLVEHLARGTGTAVRGTLTAALELAEQGHHLLGSMSVPDDLVSEIKDQISNRPNMQTLERAAAQAQTPAGVSDPRPWRLISAMRPMSASNSSSQKSPRQPKRCGRPETGSLWHV